MGTQDGQFSGELTDHHRIGGGPANCDGPEVQRAHAGMDISREHYAKVVSSISQALEEAGVGLEIVGRVGDALADTENDVVSAGAR